MTEAIGEMTILDKGLSKFLGSNTLVTLKYFADKPGEFQVIRNGKAEVVKLESEMNDWNIFPSKYIVVNGIKLELNDFKFYKMYRQ